MENIKQIPFEPPTEHYDKQIEGIDEQICNLIKQRKDLSNNNPGFPTNQFISAWSKKYNLCEEFLNGVFGIFFNEEIYRPVIEPKGFFKNIPILKSFEKGDLFYSVTFVRQYGNASVVHLVIDRDDSAELPGEFPEYTYFDLSIKGEGAEYDCRNEDWGGYGGHTSYAFIVSPPLPDDISELELVFTEYETSNSTKPTGLEFVIS